ncbi:MAG: hypothetical protein R3C40_03270 [Parvularculaceae bacterium]
MFYNGIWVAGNEYLQIAAPWTAFKAGPGAAGYCAWGST